MMLAATSQGATGTLAHFPYGSKQWGTKRLSTVSDDDIDYYAILGLASTATAEDIKNAHVALALKHHPDLSTVDDGGKRFLAISEAWSVLGKPEQRQG
jgi:preprotein translocase subunit Sec63